MLFYFHFELKMHILWIIVLVAPPTNLRSYSSIENATHRGIFEFQIYFIHPIPHF